MISGMVEEEPLNVGVQCTNDSKLERASTGSNENPLRLEPTKFQFLMSIECVSIACHRTTVQIREARRMLMACVLF